MSEVFLRAGIAGWLHARDMASGREVGHRPDEPVVAASVFKIPVLLELALRVNQGQIDPASRLLIGPAGRAPGPTGFSAFQDPVEVSVRDAALSMMSVSDNAATDVLMGLLGVERINQTLRGLELDSTILVGDCRELLASLPGDTGAASFEEVAALPEDCLRRWRALDASRTTRTTARDTTRLLELLWTDAAGPAGPCAFVRHVMAAQVWPHRLRSGFGDGIRVSGKTGSLPGIRNEAGVVEYPDGGRYAVAVFTRAPTLETVLPAADSAIGAAARAAVDELRTTR